MAIENNGDCDDDDNDGVDDVCGDDDDSDCDDDDGDHVGDEQKMIEIMVMMLVIVTMTLIS